MFLVQLKGSGSSASPAAPPAPAASAPQMSLDTPRANATMTQPFAVAGWAADAAATANAGVDWVDVWAFPNPGTNAAAIYVGGAAPTGARPDVAAYLGPQFLISGFGVTVKGLPPGVYLINAYAHSRVTGTFNDVRGATVTIVGNPPRMSIDTPGAG